MRTRTSAFAAGPLRWAGERTEPHARATWGSFTGKPPSQRSSACRVGRVSCRPGANSVRCSRPVDEKADDEGDEERALYQVPLDGALWMRVAHGEGDDHFPRTDQKQRVAL